MTVHTEADGKISVKTLPQQTSLVVRVTDQLYGEHLQHLISPFISFLMSLQCLSSPSFILISSPFAHFLILQLALFTLPPSPPPPPRPTLYLLPPPLSLAVFSCLSVRQSSQSCIFNPQRPGQIKSCLTRMRCKLEAAGAVSYGFPPGECVKRRWGEVSS